MPIPPKFLAPFIENGIYHIYNRTNNKEKLFLSDENRYFFLRRYKDIVSPFVDTYCWNLLPNHFHLLIKVKSEENILAHLSGALPETLTNTEIKFLKSKTVNFKNQKPNFNLLIQQTFKRFFQSYTLSFNKMHNRKGNLFYKPFKRVCIENDAQFTRAIIYVQTNAAKHRLVKDFTSYKWSSWHNIISQRPSFLLRDDVIDWFGNLEICIKIHEEFSKDYYNCDLAIEDYD